MSLGPVPTREVLVRNEFFYNEKRGHGQYTPAYLLGFCSLQGRAPSFQVMCHNGAQWARVPIHMLCTKESEPLPLSELCWWDCLGAQFSIATLPLLKNTHATCLTRTHQKLPGSYWFTVDYYGNELFDEVPDQHKNHHIIELASGHLAAYPNNRVLWSDPSYITPMTEAPDWEPVGKVWSAETTDLLQDLNRQFYQTKA